MTNPTMTSTLNPVQKLAIGGALSALGVGALAGLNTSSVHADVSHHGSSYQIVWGDTLGGIAYKFGTTVEAIAAENGIANPNLIYAGDIIYIPGYGSAESTESAAPAQEPVQSESTQTTQPVEQAPVQQEVQPTQTPQETTQNTQVSGNTYEEMIRSVFGVYADQAISVAWCESTMNPNAYNGILGASGLFQIIPSTWASTSVGASGASVFDPAANIRGAYELFAGDGYTWAQWACKP